MNITFCEFCVKVLANVDYIYVECMHVVQSTFFLIYHLLAITLLSGLHKSCHHFPDMCRCISISRIEMDIPAYILFNFVFIYSK